jgi:hypothetical protein
VVCQDNFADSETVGKRGMSQMLNEGFYDLTLGDVNCVLNSASFTAIVNIEGEIREDTFYITNSLFDSPTDDLWVQTIESLLIEFNGVGEINFDLATNVAVIKSKCVSKAQDCLQVNFNQLTDQNVLVSLEINYDVSCVSCSVTTTTTTP